MVHDFEICGFCGNFGSQRFSLPGEGRVERNDEGARLQVLLPKQVANRGADWESKTLQNTYENSYCGKQKKEFQGCPPELRY